MASERYDQEFLAGLLLGLIPDLPRAAASLLTRSCLLRKFAAGDLIIKEGESSNGIFLLIFGTVQPSISNSNGTSAAKKQVTLHHISAPAVLGTAGSMLSQPSSFTVTALTNLVAAFISQSHIGSVLRDYPQAGLAFSHLLAQELASTYTHLGQLRCPEPISTPSAV